ncbi:hypothetical protein TI39_contig305g00028 [Zymoseptoria brevis]|uniref:RlpA-like protein double-psi beta-barrel domain-containing protein n=1 Tax=Zymoseptoria brevis TaxID=1047168 RepID=A0A0F4GUH0_9PEZI|nr:hypothetical protein TI39_contig305g00028 [Zymoseptoria brevis]
MKGPLSAGKTAAGPHWTAFVKGLGYALFASTVAFTIGSGIATYSLLACQTSQLRIHSRDFAVPQLEGMQNGDITFFEPSMGSCGVQSNANEAVVAISAVLFDSHPESAAQGGNPNQNPLCGKVIRLERVHNGVPCSVDATIVDRCAKCGEADLDVTEHVFRQLAAPDMGRVQATWSWL